MCFSEGFIKSYFSLLPKFDLIFCDTSYYTLFVVCRSDSIYCIPPCLGKIQGLSHGLKLNDVTVKSTVECFVSSCYWSSCSLSLSFELFIDQEKHCYFDSTCNSRDQMLDGELETVTCRWFQDLLRLDLRGLLSKRFSLATSLKIAREGQM